jgi:hypothetical protein
MWRGTIKKKHTRTQMTTLHDVQTLISRSNTSVRQAEKDISTAYARAREARGFRGTHRLSLAFADDKIVEAAQYLYDRAFAGSSWGGPPDKSLADALTALIAQNNPTIQPRSPVSPPRERPSSPSQIRLQLTRVDLLMLGATHPHKERRTDVEEFLRRVCVAEETGSNAIARVVEANVDDDRLHRLANRFLEPPLATLQNRVNSILARDAALEGEVSRTLARTIRATQDVAQQLIRANSQLSRAMRETLRKIDVPKSEQTRASACLARLDAARLLSVREMNQALLETQNVLQQNGIPGKAALAQGLL